jgi:hypothetical protein
MRRSRRKPAAEAVGLSLALAISMKRGLDTNHIFRIFHIFQTTPLPELRPRLPSEAERWLFFRDLCFDGLCGMGSEHGHQLRGCRYWPRRS